MNRDEVHIVQYLLEQIKLSMKSPHHHHGGGLRREAIYRTNELLTVSWDLKTYCDAMLILPPFKRLDERMISLTELDAIDNGIW